MGSILLTLFQFLFLLAISPLSIGITRKMKAFFQGREGASVFLPYITIATLMKKEMVISSSTSWVFRIVPYVVLTSTLFLTATLPLVMINGVLAPLSNFILVAAVLAIGSIFLVFGGLDSASAFGGMGSAREMTITSFVEPTVITIFATLAVSTGVTTIDGMVGMGGGDLIIDHPYLILTMVAFFLMALAENARYPVDNPATHLELTMVHEAMIIEYSGPYLAILEYSSAMKLTVFGLLFGNLLFPITLASDATISTMVIASGWAVLKLVGTMIGIALLESTIAKLRFYRLQEYLTASFFIALGGLIIAVFL